MFTVLCQIYTWLFKASDKSTATALSYSQFHDKNTPTNILEYWQLEVLFRNYYILSTIKVGKKVNATGRFTINIKL